MRRMARIRTAPLLSCLGIVTCLATAVRAQTDPAPPASRPDAPARSAEPMSVGFLVLEGVYNSELIAPFDIFHHTVFHTRPGMRVFTVGRESGLVRTFEGLRIGVDYALEDAPKMDVLVVPSAEHNMGSDLEDERLIAWIRTRGQEARYVLSVCDGAFPLAAAGLLDGRRCTTFPGDIAAFREHFPKATVIEGVSFVADGPMITGVGGARSYDPALYLVEHLYGPKIARGVGRGMALRWDLEKVRHLALANPSGAVRCYLPGDSVDRTVAVEDARGRPVRLADVVAARPNVRAVVLTILGGAEAKPVAGRGGVWCEDTFSELANLRHLHLDYAPRGVLFVGVLCPPVHDETRFGYDEGAFLRRSVDDPVYEANRARFVEASGILHDQGVLPFDVVLFDPRFRLLGDPAAGGAAVAYPTWQGRFKWFQDTQTYGTPTIWVLTRDLEIPGPPFFMNVYESDGRKLRYTPDDIAGLLERVLAPQP